MAAVPWAGGGRRQQPRRSPACPAAARFPVRPEAGCDRGYPAARDCSALARETSWMCNQSEWSLRSWSGILADCCGTWHQECGCSCPGEFGCSGLACVPRGVQSPPPHGLGCRPQCGRASPPFAVERHHVVVRPRQDRGAAGNRTRLCPPLACGGSPATRSRCWPGPGVVVLLHGVVHRVTRRIDAAASLHWEPRSDTRGRVGLASWQPGDSSAA